MIFFMQVAKLRQQQRCNCNEYCRIQLVPITVLDCLRNLKLVSSFCSLDAAAEGYNLVAVRDHAPS
jgi:hypothetical protein